MVLFSFLFVRHKHIHTHIMNTHTTCLVCMMLLVCVYIHRTDLLGLDSLLVCSFSGRLFPLLPAFLSGL